MACSYEKHKHPQIKKRNQHSLRVTFNIILLTIILLSQHWLHILLRILCLLPVLCQNSSSDDNSFFWTVNIIALMDFCFCSEKCECKNQFNISKSIRCLAFNLLHINIKWSKYAVIFGVIIMIVIRPDTCATSNTQPPTVPLQQKSSQHNTF